MKILWQFAVILGILLFSEFICALLPVPVPANILGMVILLLLLTIKVIRPEHIKEAADFLFKNMAFFVIPVTLGIMEQYRLLNGGWVMFLSITIISTLLVFGLSGKAVELTQRLLRKRQGTK